MADVIIDGDQFDWSKSRGNSKGATKYRHLLDGNARVLHLSDYPQFASIENMRVTLKAVARHNGLESRIKVLDYQTMAFQITGKKVLCGS
jgi:hypothetical protein